MDAPDAPAGRVTTPDLGVTIPFAPRDDLVKSPLEPRPQPKDEKAKGCPAGAGAGPLSPTAILA